MRRYKIAEKTGRKLRRIRRNKKLSQEEVASRAKMHITTYGRIERGESNPPLQTLNRIAKALGVKVSDFV